MKYGHLNRFRLQSGAILSVCNKGIRSFQISEVLIVKTVIVNNVYLILLMTP